MKKFLKIFICLIVIVVITFACAILYLNYGLKAGSNTTINGLNMSDINDGVYNGKYKFGRWSNNLDVTVKHGKIIYIKIIKDVTFVKPDVRDELFIRVIEAQNTEVDVISGATVTSKAYLKSIENALSNND